MRPQSVFAVICAVLVAVQAVESTAAGQDVVSVSQLCTRASSELQQCSRDPAVGAQESCCAGVKVLQELGCFCMDATKEASRSAVTPNVWAALPSCLSPVKIDFTVCTSSADGSTLPIPGVISVPGKGFVQISAVEESLSSESGSEQPLTQGSGSNVPDQIYDSRPVLDLSTLPDDLEIISGEDGVDMTVTLVDGEAREGQPKSSLSFDVSLPRAMLKEGVEFNLDIVDTELEKAWGDLSIAEDVDCGEEDELEDNSREEYELADTAFSDDALVRQLAKSEKPLEGEYTMELDLEIPSDMMQSLGASDVMIEMDVDFDGPSSLSETAITVERSQANFPLSGQGLGNLLVEVAEWLSAFLPMPLTDEFATSEENDEMAGVLGGALLLLSDVGEEISEKIPEQQLEAGDTVEVWIQASLEASREPAATEELPEESSPLLFGRKALDSLGSAVKSALYSKNAEQQVQQQVACAICEFVHNHIQLLWGILYANVALLCGCLGFAVFRAIVPADKASPTLPDSELHEPLILSAADYAEPISLSGKQFPLFPQWEPASKVQQ